jgi:hypothetical protein
MAHGEKSAKNNLTFSSLRIFFGPWLNFWWPKVNR